MDAGEADAGTSDAGARSDCYALGEPLPAGSPSPFRRGDMASAYDPDCDRVLLFFGDKGEAQSCGFAASDFLDDAFAFEVSTGTWHALPVTSDDAPLPRARSAGAWDARRKRALVFGGRWRAGTTGAYTFLNDLWAFDPYSGRWEELSPRATSADRPSGRMNTSLDADPGRDRVIVHAGGTTDFTRFFVNDDTWAWNLDAGGWSKIAGAGTKPAGRLFHMSSIDPLRGRLFVFAGGGEDAFTSFGEGELWTLDFAENAWTQVRRVPSFPRPRIKGAMIADPDRDRLVLFGGHDDTDLGNRNDLWALDLESLAWTELSPGDAPNDTTAIAQCEFAGDFAAVDPASPERRESHLFVRAGGRAVMYGGRTDCGLASDTWTLDLQGASWTQIHVSPSGMTCERNGNPNCADPSARMCD